MYKKEWRIKLNWLFCTGDEVNILRERLQVVEAENSQLTSALQEAMEDNAHMSEKVLLSEQAQESLRVS